MNRNRIGDRDPMRRRKRVGKGTYIPIYESDTRKIGVAVGALVVNSKRKKKP